jgi:hypothetical protein
MKQNLIQHLLGAIVVFAAAGLLSGPQAFADRASFTDEAEIEVLSRADVAAYQAALAAGEAADWAAQDAALARISDPVLEGHVWLSRYMHPTGWRSTHAELAAWLNAFADLPGADRVHRLAEARAPTGVATPNPIRTRPRGGIRAPRADADGWRAGPDFNTLWAAFDAGEFERVARLVPAGQDGPDGERAFVSGLAHWRLGRFDEAAVLFARSEPTVKGVSEPASDPEAWGRGRFWAGRALLRAGARENDAQLLAASLDLFGDVSDGAPTTFYGLLAERLIGRDASTPGAPDVLSAAQWQDVFVQWPGARRALAASQIGREDIAAAEIEHLHRQTSPSDDGWLMALARACGLPRLEYTLASRAGSPFATGRYPVIPLRPADGLRLDRAVILAVIHKESRFDPAAKSGSGARGLMQLMPSTAAWMDQRADLRTRPEQLYEPELNKRLGQRYIEMMLDQAPVKGDLMLAFAAYNAGPGTISRWWKRFPATDDPLLAMESLPTEAARIYARKTFANLWIYQDHFGQDIPTLDAFAQSIAPLYAPLDTP